MVSPQDEKDTECVLTDAPNQCGAFCMSAQRPLFEHNRIIQNQIYEISSLQAESHERLKRIENELINLQIEQKESKQAINENDETKVEGIETTTSVNLIKKKKYVIVDKALNWYNAVKFCQEIGGKLAEFSDEHEYDTVISTVEPDTCYWIGIRSYNNEHQSLRTDNRPLYLKMADMPNNNIFNGENCVGIQNGFMHDLWCNLSYYSICTTSWF